MNNFKIIFFAFLFISTFSFCDDHVWPAYTKIIVPDSLKSEDVFLIKNTTSYDFLNNYTTAILNFKRFYINTKIGVETFSAFSLPIYREGNIELIKSRIIKKNGDFVEISGDNIKKTFIKGNFNYSKKNIKRIQFIYPGLEEGDVIDIEYKLVYDFFINSEMLYLENYFQSLNSKIILRNQAPGLDISVFSINSTAKYTLYDGDHTWEQDGVKALKTDGFNAFNSKTPRFYYSLISAKTDLSYEFIYVLDTDSYPLSKSFDFNKITKSLLLQGVFNENDSLLVKVNKIIQEFKKYEWISSYIKKTNVSHLDYFKDKKINEELFFKYMQAFLDDNKIQYERSYTNSLLNGPFEKGILAYAQLENRFLSIKDAGGNDHFIFPPENEGHFYNLDEIPFFNEGNKAILMIGTELSIKNVASLQLPESAMNENKLTSQIRMKVQKNDSIIGVYSRKDVATGQFSNLIRRNEKGEDEAYWFESFGISTKKIPLSKEQSVFPYEIEIKQDSLKSNCFEPIEDSMYWLNISEFIPEFVFEDDTPQEELGSYLVLPFKHFKSFSFYIENESGISCVEKENTLVKTNSIGEISTKCIQVSPTMLKVEYSIKLKERIINGDDKVKDYLDLLQNWKEISSKKWIIKIS